MGDIEISVIIVNYNTKQVTLSCLASVLANINEITHELIVVDNGSSDGSVETIEKTFPSVVLIKNQDNSGFAKAVNQGIKLSKGEIVILLNSDITVTEPIFTDILSFFKKNTDVGVMGGKLFYPNGEIQLSAWKFPDIVTELFQRIFIFRVAKKISFFNNYWKNLQHSKEVDWVTGAFMCIRKSVLEKAGMFDETFFMYYEDTDLCKRVKDAGFKIIYKPNITVIHHDALTRKKMPWPIYLQARKSQYYYYWKNCGKAQTAILRAAVIFIIFLKLKFITLTSRNNADTEKIVAYKTVLKEMLKSIPGK